MNTRSDTRLEKRPNVEQTSTNIYPSFSKQGNKTTHTNENLYCSKVIFKLDPKMHFIISTQTVPHRIIEKMRYIWNVGKTAVKYNLTNCILTHYGIFV